MKPTQHLTPPRGIDHLVIAGHDLAKLADFYTRLGFQVGARNSHPWGTENHIVQFPGAFLELIGIGDAAKIPPMAPRFYSFGAFLRDYLAGGEGLAMLVLESRNAVAEAEAFRRARIGDFEPFTFERTGIGPDGKPVPLGFTLAFAQMPEAPRAGFFVCQQLKPQNFWNSARQHHDNRVTGIASVTLVAEDPADHHEFLGTFIGQREMRSVSGELELETGRGRLSVLTPAAFAYRFGCAPPAAVGPGPWFGAITFRSADLSATRGVIKAGAIDYLNHHGASVVSADAALGVVLAFSE